MESKRITTQVTYRIEPKPAGGFIAHPTEGNGNTLEAPTREDLQEKIREQSLSSLFGEFPILKGTLENRSLGTTFHIDRTPDGNFAAHSDDPNAADIEGSTKEEVETKLVEKYLGMANKDLLQKFVQAVNAQGSTDIKVVVKSTTSATSIPGLLKGGFGTSKAPALTGAPESSDLNPGPGNSGQLNYSPIVPEANGTWKVIAFAVVLLVVAGYFILR